METFPPKALTWAVLVAGAGASVATVAVFARAFADDPFGFTWSAPFMGAFVAGVVAFRLRPHQVAARRLLLFGTLGTIWIGGTVALALAYDAQGREWWLAPANIGVQHAGLAMEAAMVGLLAVYPNGRYTRPYERVVVRAAAGVALALPLLLLVVRPTVQPSWGFTWDSGTESAFPSIASPLHVEAVAFLGAPLRGLLDGALALGPLASVVVVWLRYRRMQQEQQAQIRWPMYGVLVLLLMPLAALLHEFGALPLLAVDAVVVIALSTLPISVVVGLVRPDLFDIDRAMGRSLLYAPLWVLIAAAYVGIAAALGTAASALGLQVTVVVTILATLLIEPARRRIARRAATWTRARSLTGEEMVRWLGSTLEHRLDLDQLTAALAKAASEGLGVRWARIRVDGQSSGTYGTVATRDQEPAMSAELTYAGDHLGIIDCGPRIRGRVGAADRESLETLARQAAVILHNARLAAELTRSLDEVKLQAEELSASRSRIVAAEASARRQIERDIHDGAQQDLVGLIAKIGLARNRLGPDANGLGTTLEELQAGARDALTNLRQLASGIHPTELSDHGLVEAIEGRSARLPIGVTIDCAPELRTARFPEEIEGAAYFFVSEALANTLKHARAQRACIRLACSAGRLEIQVVDDGVGFGAQDCSTPGLRGLADRMEALGGAVAVDSAPGNGTTLSASLPIGGHRG